MLLFKTWSKGYIWIKKEDDNIQVAVVIWTSLIAAHNHKPVASL